MPYFTPSHRRAETPTDTFDRSRETNADTQRANQLKPAGFVSLFRKTAEEFIQDKMSAVGRCLGLLHCFFVSSTGVGAFGRIWTSLRRE